MRATWSADPFAGGGVTAYVAESLGRRWIVGDINDCAAVKEQERLISWEKGRHPEWETDKKRIAEPSLANGVFANLPDLSRSAMPRRMLCNRQLARARAGQ